MFDAARGKAWAFFLRYNNGIVVKWCIISVIDCLDKSGDFRIIKAHLIIIQWRLVSLMYIIYG